jgi:hypothetical protein
MKNRYLIVDGMLNGTGIRNPNDGGYLSPEEVGISETLTLRIKKWLKEYEAATFLGFEFKETALKLDKEGITIAKLLQAELPESKITYYSDATQKRVVI